MTTEPEAFIGAKGALFYQGSVLTLQRDDLPGLRWAGMWDLPGGGREQQETPAECFLRELCEELAVILPPERLLWGASLPSVMSPQATAWLFAGHLTDHEIPNIKLGDEGQAWTLMPVGEFLAHTRAIPQMKERVILAAQAIGISVPGIR